jgi:hypothetical protein
MLCDRFMNVRFRAPLFLSILLSLAVTGLAENPLRSTPFGYVKLNIAAGTGTAKRTTLLSIPLLEDANITGRSTGRITGVTSNTITSTGAGWAPGELSQAAEPYLLEITSGSAAGRMLLIASGNGSANTADTLTVASTDVTINGSLAAFIDLEEEVNFRIRPVDTLSSLFGSPSTTGIRGGTTPAQADTIVMVVNGSASTFYFDTSLNRWTLVAVGTPDASHRPILPNSGLQYSRLPASPLQFVVTGRLPDGPRKAPIKSSGTTLFSQFWPVSSTLGELALQNTDGWQTGTFPNSDRVVVQTSTGSFATYWHDGDNWRQQRIGSPISDNVPVGVGAALLITRRGIGAGHDFVTQEVPYSLD